jgi:hypothetical protein
MNDRTAGFYIIFLSVFCLCVTALVLISGEAANDFDTMCVAAGGTTIRNHAHSQIVCVNTIDIIELENR